VFFLALFPQDKIGSPGFEGHAVESIHSEPGWYAVECGSPPMPVMPVVAPPQF
jgi:hypothetical protein